MCMCECDREASIMRRPWPTRGCCVMEIYIYLNIKRNEVNHIKTAVWRKGLVRVYVKK